MEKERNIGLAKLQLFHYLSATHTQASKYTQDLQLEAASFPSRTEMEEKRGRKRMDRSEMVGNLIELLLL